MKLSTRKKIKKNASDTQDGILKEITGLDQVVRYCKRDFTGHVSGDLICLGDTGEREPKTGEILWKCICSCGREIKLRTNKVSHQKSCGICKKIERGKLERAKYRSLLKYKRKRVFDILSNEEKYDIIDAFLNGVNGDTLDQTYHLYPHSTLSSLRALTSQLNILLEISLKSAAINDLQGTPTLDVDKAVEKILARSTQTLIQEYTSDPLSPELTPQEISFSFLYSATGSLFQALKESGFKDCLQDGCNTSAYLQILGTFLLSKPNIKDFLQKLENDKTLLSDFSKKEVQGELVNQIYQLKEELAINPTKNTRGHMLKAIELLGRTIGAYQDKIQIEEVNPGDALDKLIEAAQTTYQITDV